jgi:hypothetical protein
VALAPDELAKDLAASIDSMEVRNKGARPSSGIFLRPRPSSGADSDTGDPLADSKRRSQVELDALVEIQTSLDDGEATQDLSAVAEVVATASRPRSVRPQRSHPWRVCTQRVTLGAAAACTHAHRAVIDMRTRRRAVMVADAQRAHTCVCVFVCIMLVVVAWGRG